MATTPARPPPPPDKEYRAIGSVILWGLVVVLLGMLVHQGLHNSFHYRLFSDRELLRGARFWTDLPTSGSEMTGAGVRLPGPLLPLLFWLPRLVSTDPHAVYALQLAAAGAAIVLLAHATAKHLGPWAAAVATYLAVAPMPWRHTITMLWNPGFLPLPVACITAGLLAWVMGRDTRGLTWVAIGAGLGVQVHMSTMGLIIACLPVLILTRPPDAMAATRRALAWFGLLMAPYIVGEILSGGANLRIYWSASSAVLPDGGFLGKVTDQLAMLLSARNAADGLQMARQAPAQLALTALPWLAGIAGLANAGWLVLGKGRQAPSSARACLALGASGALYVLLLGLSSAPEPVPRYLIAALPILSVATAAGWQTTLATLGNTRWGRGPAYALGGCVVVGTWWGTGTAWMRLANTLPADSGTWQGLHARIQTIQTRQDWTLGEVFQRTLWTRRSGDGELSLRHAPSWPGMSTLLHNQGVQFHGSGAPPCALYIVQTTDEPLSEDTAHRVLAELLPDAVPESSFVPNLHERVVIYDRPDQPCPTSMVQRYIDLPVEAQLHDQWASLPCLRGTPLPAPEGTARFGTAIPAHDPQGPCLAGLSAAAAIDLHLDDMEIAVTLHSKQLRGLADNFGWFSSIRIQDPTLHLEPLDGSPSFEIRIARGSVGGVGVVTPLSTPPHPWSPTPSRVVWSFDLSGPPNGHQSPQPVSVVLSERWPSP